jgi:hypothetical protein
VWRIEENTSSYYHTKTIQADYKITQLTAYVHSKIVLLSMLMLIPDGDSETAVCGCGRQTCKGKGHTVGFPSGPPPTPKLDEVFFREKEREREFRTSIQKNLIPGSCYL